MDKFKSFGDWCIENGKQICLDYWADEISPYDIPFNSSKRYAFWCGNPEHPVFYRQPSNIIRAKGDFTCPGCTSFGEWCIKNGKWHYLDMWIDELNGNPFNIPFRSNKRMAFYCGNSNHPIFYKIPGNIVRYQNDISCPGCESFGQYVVDAFGEEYLHEIWSDKNTKSSFEVPKSTCNEKIWLKCLKDKNHPDYETVPENFYKGSRCPYCVNKKIYDGNSLLNAMPGIAQVWSDKNIKAPNEYPPAGNDKVWIQCAKHIHPDFERTLNGISNHGYECPECRKLKIAKERSEDLTGQIFGRLTVIGPDPNDNRKCICECSCEDHTILSVFKQSLKRGLTISCGCYHLECISGENNHFWRGGIAEYHQEGRYTLEYRTFREDVMKRDNYTCQCCEKHGVALEVHHILNYADNEDLRYDTLNGITLCQHCHSSNFKGSFHNIYGTSNNTPEQLEEFINNKREELGIEECFSFDKYIRESKEKEEMANERTCIMCETQYKYCPHCSSFKNAPKWMALFDKEVCKDVFNIISGYNVGSITPEDAKKQLSELDLGGINFKQEHLDKINEIMGIKNDETHIEDNDEEIPKIEYKAGRGKKRKKLEESTEVAEQVVEEQLGITDTQLNDASDKTTEENVDNDIFE